MNEGELKVAMKGAKRRVMQMDMQDGFKDRMYGTIAAALRCGLLMPESGAQFDALVMLSEMADAEKRAMTENK